MIRISMKGHKETIEKLKRARKDLNNGEIVAEAWQTHRMVLVPTAKAEAPFDTGDVRESIRTRVEGNKMILEATSPDAKYPHEGTSKQAPNPFLVRAVEQTMPDLNKRIQTAFDKRLK
ncbi:hypothetical protein D3C86_1450180 [compost metagenome]